MTARIDPHGDTWRVVRAWAEQQQADSLRALDDPATDPTMTAVHRGRRAALRELLALTDPEPPRPAIPLTPYT